MRVIGGRIRNRPQSTHGSLYNLQLNGKHRPNTHCRFDIRVRGMTLEDLPRPVEPKTDTRAFRREAHCRAQTYQRFVADLRMNTVALVDHLNTHRWTGADCPLSGQPVRSGTG